MRKLASVTLSLFLLSGTAFADTPKEADAQPAKLAQPAKPKAAKKADKPDSAIAAQLEELREALQSQQEQLQLLKEELAKRDRQIDEAREAAAAANARAAEASSKAAEVVNSTAEFNTTAAALNTTVSDIKASNEVLKTAVAREQTEAKKASEEGPSTIRYKGINITPGGFIAAETVFRNRATSGDINTPFTGIPFPGNSLSKVSENNFTARQSRLSLLAETKVGSTKLTGYYEADFLGAGTTSNNRQSNSYVMRQRQVWANVTWDNGFSLAGGQMWSLVTESTKGIANRREAFPFQIDPQYVVGWSWQRAYAFRVVKDFGKFAVGAAIEGPQTTGTFHGSALSPATFFINAPGNGGGLYNGTDGPGYTTNRAPDFLVKGTFDPGWGHYEVVGIVSNFRNRVYPCGLATTAAPCPVDSSTRASAVGAFNDSRVGGGVGITARFPVVAKKVDLVAHFQGGEGIGRYSSAQLPDVTARPDGTLALIRTAAWLGSLEVHPNAKLDLYAYGGGEYAGRTAYTITNGARNPVPVGYGSPLFNNSGCATELPAGANGISPSGGAGCTGDIHHIVEGTFGFWHKLYNGPKGRVQWGLQYSYLTKVGWSGNNFNSGTGVAGPSLRPKAVDNMVFTSFRYYLP